MNAVLRALETHYKALEALVPIHPILSETNYRADVDGEGIELINPFEIPKEIQSQLAEGVFPVAVTGVFDAKYVGSNVVRLGALRGITHMTIVRRLRASGIDE